MEFDWDPGKRAKTIAERALDFVEVLPGFQDPRRRITVDSRKDYGEIRYNMLATCNGRVFHVTFTQRGAITWIISARKANKREQRRYEQA